ncbi:MAG: GGDEF domain-containing protein [Xanthobacteraceae bacterium]
MAASVFIALINPGMALIFAGTFALLWHHQRQRRYILILSSAYMALACGFLLLYVSAFGFEASKLASTILFLAGGVSLAAGALVRYGRKLPAVPILLIGGVGILAFAWFLYIEPNISWRIYAINFAFGGICLVLAAELRLVQHRKVIDNVMLGIVLFWGISFFPRPIVAIWIDGPYTSNENLYETLYWVTLTVSDALFLLLFSLAMITAIALDVMDELLQKSQTDPLSGLLNRRGFEEGITAALAESRREVPATLIVCDIDHFKSVNDRFGHAGGDRVIERFAECLRAAAEGQHLAGRIGGEEFALLLDNADATTARLFAEGVRIAFSNVAVPGIPLGTRLTASFGVAEAMPGETGDSLFLRADKTLYEAKNMGRDCVRVSSPPLDARAAVAA